MTQQPTNPQNEIDLRKLVLTCLKKWYWFVLSVVLCLCMAVIFLVRKTPVFEVSSTIMIRESDGGALSGISQMEALSLLGMGGSKSVTDELEIYTSCAIMEDALRSLQLQTAYSKKKGPKWYGQYPNYDLTVRYPQQFCDTMKRSVNMELTYRGNSWRLKVKYGSFPYCIKSSHSLLSLNEPVETCIGTLEFDVLQPVKKGTKYRITTTPMPFLVDDYRKAIDAQPIKKGSNIVRISTNTTTPAKAKALIAKLTELYNFDAVIDKTTTTQATKTFLDERLSRIVNQLDSAELAVERYKKQQHITSLTDEAVLYLESAGEYKKAIVETETQLNLIDYIREFVSEPDNAHNLIPANLGITDNALVQLIGNYNQLLLKQIKIQRTATSENPMLTQLEEQLTIMRSNILTSIASVRDGLLITKADLQRQQELFSGRVSNIPQQEREYVILKRQQQIMQSLYIFLYQKREENDLALISTCTPCRLVDKPQTAPYPVAPRTKLILFIALIFGMGIPAGILLLLELLNNKITNRKQYESLLEAPVSGCLPYSKGNNLPDSATGNAPFAESLRLLRNNLITTLPTDRSCVILCTSATRGEGKTHIAAGLALSLTLLGKKVVLLEADLRNPSLATRLNLLANGNLTAYLAGNSSDADLVPSGISDLLHIVPAGDVPHNPNELLTSPRLDQLLARLKEQFDYILIDSPATTIVSDAFLLNRLADHTLFISRARHTPANLTEFINQTYTSHRLHNMTCVLNGLKDMPANYGY